MLKMAILKSQRMCVRVASVCGFAALTPRTYRRGWASQLAGGSILVQSSLYL